MRTFEIRKINDLNAYSSLIFSTCYLNPLDNLCEIEEILKSQGQGKVLFDLLLSNGNTSNRFIEAVFDGEKFITSSFKIPKCIDKSIKELSSQYYKDNEQFWNSNIVSNAFKFLLKKGKV